jgi:asparagine synthase (glutamine-hydrolysing)
MFRYIGFRWDPAAPAAAAFARQLDESVRRAKGWELALANAGLRVYTIGHRAGINGVYALPHEQGVILGRLFPRHGGAGATQAFTLSDAESERILATHGQALVSDYWGRYVAVLRPGQRGTRLLRDPSGALPCYLRHVEGTAIFFSWLEDVIALTPNSPAPRVDWAAIAGLMHYGHLGGCETAIEGVSQVLPGQGVSLDDAMAPPVTLWSAVAVADKPIEPPPDIAAAQLRQVVLDCVSAWSSCYPAILLRLSGGVDSAILLGSLCAWPDRSRIACLNYHSVGSDSDERVFARLAAAKAGVELIEKERDAAFRLDTILGVSRTPTPQSYVGRMDTSRIDAEVASGHRADAMFTGAGGDQLFFQRRCTWPSADYLHHHGLGRGFVRASLDAARLGRVSLWQSMRRAFAEQGHRPRPLDGIGQLFTLTRRDACDAAAHASRYAHPNLAKAAELPIGKCHQVQDLIIAPNYYDPYLREAAPEIVNPLLSQPVIELCLSMPTWLLTNGGRSRALARTAFARELPREIANRQSKGGMDEHVATVLSRNLPLARSLLLDGYLVRQGLLDRQKVEAALDDRLSALDAQLGEIHHHLATEAWLRRFMDTAR